MIAWTLNRPSTYFVDDIGHVATNSEFQEVMIELVDGHITQSLDRKDRKSGKQLR